MERHPYFDLWLHDTPELSAHLGVEIVERVTIHDWPLSCVQLLRLADGKQVIYKSQLRATSVEPDIFAAVNSDRAGISNLTRSRLPRADTLGTLENSVGMIIEYIDTPRLEDLQLTEAEIVGHGNRLLIEIGQFPVDLPVYIDISSRAKWLVFVDQTLSMLRSLINRELFRLTTPAMVQSLAEWSQSQAVMTALQSPSTFNHGDLGGDNVFVIPEGYKIIDWQRPVRGPAELDRVTYLFAMGVDPLKYTHRCMNELNWFIHLRWFTECKLHWFPPGESYDRQVAELAGLILNLPGLNSCGGIP
jgi:hypothetical protein